MIKYILNLLFNNTSSTVDDDIPDAPARHKYAKPHNWNRWSKNRRKRYKRALS